MRDEADAEDGEEDDRSAAAADHAGRIADGRGWRPKAGAEAEAARTASKAATPELKRRAGVSAMPLLRPAAAGGSFATFRSRTMPMALSSFSVIQEMSNSYQARPWRAETGWAWWLLCQPSPNVSSATHQLLRESSRVSNRRDAPHVRRRVHQPRRVQAERRRAGRCPTAPSASRRPRAGSGRRRERHPVIGVQPAVERIGAEVGRVLATSPRCCCGGSRRTGSSPCAPRSRRRAACAGRLRGPSAGGARGAWRPRRSVRPRASACRRRRGSIRTPSRSCSRGACAAGGSRG